jgi:hypothetical protein
MWGHRGTEGKNGRHGRHVLGFGRVLFRCLFEDEGEDEDDFGLRSCPVRAMRSYLGARKRP